MFAVRVAHASTGIAMPRFSLYSSTSAVMYRARTCKSPTRPAVVSPMLSSSRYTFFVRLWAIKVPAVARRSAASTTPSLQTRPSVVVPVSTSLETATIRTLPFKRVSKTTAEAYGRHYLRIIPSIALIRRREAAAEGLQLHDDVFLRGINRQRGFEIPPHFSGRVDEGEDHVHESEFLEPSDLLPDGGHGNAVDPAHFPGRLGTREERDEDSFRGGVEPDLHDV